jgi:hypothetical protein
VLFPPVVADPRSAAGPAEVCPPPPQPSGARHTRSAIARSRHCRDLNMPAPPEHTFVVARRAAPPCENNHPQTKFRQGNFHRNDHAN